MTRDQAAADITRAVKELLQERQQLLVCFCKAAGLNSDGSKRAAVGQLAVLKRLCQVLMDYYALWQFEIYDHLLKNRDFYPGALTELQQANDLLDESRAIALGFNDKYDFGNRTLSLGGLEKDLSVLGESIAQQLSLEDRIILAMEKPH